MRTSKIFSSSDFVKQARRNLPKFAFDFIDGGSGDEKALVSNTNAFKNVKLIPRIKKGSSATVLSSEILGLTYSAPFGVAPIGLAGLVHPDADITLARAAAKYNIPYVISAASNHAIETISRASGTPPWFQLYIPKAAAQLDMLLKKADSSGCPVLVVTIDTPVPGRRLRDLHNGLKLPYRLNYANVVEALKHPFWTARRLSAGKITFPNFEHALVDSPSPTFRELMAMQTGGNLDWDVLKRIRDKFQGKLVLKGVLSRHDAQIAQTIGVDGVIVSNHGGRQLNAAPSTISTLRHFQGSGLDKKFLLLDSGIRTGDDIVAGLACGASFTFLGRVFLYALAAKGEEGVEKLIEILIDEVAVSLKLLGASNPSDVTESHYCIE